ncbi:cache domain-containing protein [Pseudomonas asiatica]|uniref:histidine kinase n=1 Tax=Pseudomonas monteilii TaxID=76759 RepID=A0A2N1IMZ8_9PSED|nr:MULTISPECIES: cache domain-containing protein [Pseudomonas]PKI19627.1 two-component sensor histidine kinase [Pseudomonas monteilii]WDM87362.1 cache domain-containing protein [Pseudomonas asiatica]
MKFHARSTVRSRLLLMVLSPLLIVLPILVGLVVYWGNVHYDDLLKFKVRSDLAVTREYFERVVGEVDNNVRNLAESNRLMMALEAGNLQPLQDHLNAVARQRQLDFLNILDSQGNHWIAGNGPLRFANNTAWPVIETALSGQAHTSIDIFAPGQLAEIGEQLRLRTVLQLIPTEKATPLDKEYETRGMVIHSAAPIYDSQNRLVAVLEGGVLLNGNLGFVDQINSIVYGDGSLPLGSQGTATLFLDDVRITTNVRLFQGERALGTRVSQQVRDMVLERGETWLERAFVVNDWYVSGYEPILDSFGNRVGMLYAGFLEAPFRNAKQTTLAVIVALFAIVSLIVSVLSLKWARTIFRPLERMDQTMSEIEAGRLDARIGHVTDRDEIGRLAQHFDELLNLLQQRNQELKCWADELDTKVLERTLALEQANRNLREAQRRLVMSEKLAAIGQLTAGVAHEINNPIAVIQGNLDVLRDVLGSDADPVRQEIRLINEQVNRIRLIVTKLLQFANPAEFAGYVEPVDVNEALGDCLVLVKHLMHQIDIKVIQDYQATRKVGINHSELQQVLVNLIVNAIHSMSDRGTLTLTTRNWEDRGVVIGVRDSGQGIRAEDLSKIYNPFYTTKKQQGTGLGLSISYSLVERYGGHLSAESEYLHGAEFSVWLLSEPVFIEEGNDTADKR